MIKRSIDDIIIEYIMVKRNIEIIMIKVNINDIGIEWNINDIMIFNFEFN